ncbi:excinuclease ABC subunit B [Candidatus Amesbacteria bacterium RIFCSPHIGHO2_02_FULL_47_9]|uniref:UvrABC system protein B n=1 Tax=Candidatus Amesbacteria bacterium RIFCSPHIGHO2_01_FULL_48_32b TaxID=1797253 RepID=A0A1F4YFT5_9BACT|nr:MAG: excinuclease ABC subunit B [Candidatus Amesbacteria bacterium RIFCSPHIGHO2_01_FULL_48_32b]OGD04995.1 MAG: excinuclease ABC subunit B [Candidatus Amesbacteria bacterium RIFCSPHIGHO2_02_FULL_47_9]OGD07123.1 MAG: excinuclease ABC subunit B [Candidatus Amesbacteria bacterium RIFCSPLOWO2_01_FULL_49_25]
MFKLHSQFTPTGDQPQAIAKLTQGLQAGQSHQVLVGVTGSGKTFTMANVIAAYQKPTLVISHNKTLAAQLYQELKEFFPENAVSYFVSYYDYYQPEAYIPQTDTYIEKETDINDEIDKLRLAATTNLLTSPDTIVVASVSCIYNLGSPVEYAKTVLELTEGLKVTRNQIFLRLNDLQYIRSDYDFHRGTYRIRGDIIDIYPAYEDVCIRVHHQSDKVTKLEKINPLTGELASLVTEKLTVYPAKHYIATKDNSHILKQIFTDMQNRVGELQSVGKILEAHRLKQRVTYDLEMIKELGYVNGIENYSRYFDGRSPGDPPYSLLDYYPEDYLLIIDESHMTIPQIRGMYNGDRSRKQTLIDFGFRLPAALDNRPLRFDEFQRRQGRTIYASATPDDWEISQSAGFITEQLIRPTGLIDPQVEIRPTQNQISDLIAMINTRLNKHQRVLVTTLTKRMAEDLTAYLKEQGIKVQYLHSDVETLERLDVLSDLRSGHYDVVVGINLLREGLDLPEVSLVAILDADKEGFLRSRTSLIQTMGRAARHVDGQVIMYADKTTNSMRLAINEVNRRRDYQIEYNKTHNITPQSIVKSIRERIAEKVDAKPAIKLDPKEILKGKSLDASDIDMAKINQLTPADTTKLIRLMTRQMQTFAKSLDFESAARLRDRILHIKSI